MEFESLPTTPTASELVDRAFSRAARAGRAKHGVDAQESMLQTASNVLSDNLRHVVTAWPDLGGLDPFDAELVAASVDVDELRQSLSAVDWAGRKTKAIGRDYRGRVRNTDPATARRLRKQGFARLASVLDEVAADLDRLGAARDVLKTIPEIRAEEPTIVVAGYPNVGKSTFVNAVTSARNETADYPFTTTNVRVGHVERRHVRYQVVDSPGLLDRPPAERNDIERQAAGALEHVADCVLFLVDASETCGYPLGAQLALRDAVAEQFDAVPLLTVGNKADLSVDVAADVYMSATGEPGPSEGPVVVDSAEAVLEAAIEAIGYEPRLPSDP